MKTIIISIVMLFLVNTLMVNDSFGSISNSKNLVNDNDFNHFVKVNKKGLSTLKYYLKQIKEDELKLSQLQHKLKRLKEGTDPYINNLVRQSTLMKRIQLWNEKIIILINSGKITTKEYYSVSD